MSGAVGGCVTVVARRAVRVETHAGTATVVDVDEGVVPCGVGVDRLPDLRRHGIRTGDTVGVLDGRTLLLAEGRVSIDLANAVHTSSQLSATPYGATADPATVAAARRVAAQHASTGGFGPLVRPSLGTTRMVAIAAEAVPVALGALASGDSTGAATAVAPLIGLGEGLTPSGDDLIVGLVAALTAAQHVAAAPFSRACADWSVGRTTVVAGDLLRHAAAGRFVERIHHLITALHDDVASTEAASTSLLRMGATSGLDTLIGVLAGFELLLPSGQGLFVR